MVRIHVLHNIYERDYSIFMYKWSYDGEYADVDEQFSLKWDDPRLNINWPIKNPILSERDK